MYYSKLQLFLCVGLRRTVKLKQQWVQAEECISSPEQRKFS